MIFSPIPSLRAAAFIVFPPPAAAGVNRCPRPRGPISTTTSFSASAQRGSFRLRMMEAGMPSFAFAASARACKADVILPVADDFEIALQFPVGHAGEPLPPFPLARGGEVIDEIVAEPVAGELRVPEVARGFDQRARGARHILGPDVGAL